MNLSQWQIFSQFRDDFRAKILEWQQLLEKNDLLVELATLQTDAALQNGTPPYVVENPLVYNTALDAIKPDSQIKLIVIGDNPGKNEQLEKNRSYLVGQAGKLAEGFFRRNPDLHIDFRKNVIILNKTPLHTAKTKELAYLVKNAPPKIHQLFTESQIWMANKTAALHKQLNRTADNGFSCDLWLVGYAELREKGLFTAYKNELTRIYSADLSEPYVQGLQVFQHFSMNRFAIDLQDFFAGKYERPIEASLAENLQQLGLLHRKTILGF